MKSVLRWVGGKSLLVNRIVALLPEHECYVETCAGGAWVFFGKPKAHSRVEVLNDIDGELVNLYRVLQRRGSRLVREVDTLPYSRSVFNQLLEGKPKSEFQRAVRFLYINRTSFGGKMRGAHFGTKPTNWCHVLPAWVRSDPAALVDRLRGAILESLDVIEIIARYDRPSTLFFVDPPYLGLSQPYAARFDWPEHTRLAKALRAIKGRFILSCSDCPEIRQLYTGLAIRDVITNYTLSRGNGKRVGEVLITNFHPPKIAISERRSRQPNER